jgi:hypothetical protein
MFGSVKLLATGGREPLGDFFSVKLHQDWKIFPAILSIANELHLMV